MTHCSKKCWGVAGLIRHFSHNKFVAVPLKKPDDAGYPKCPGCVFADVPANAPLLKVYDYGPLGARFFARCYGGSKRVGNPLLGQGARQIVFNFGVDGDIFV